MTSVALKIDAVVLRSSTRKFDRCLAQTAYSTEHENVIHDRIRWALDMLEEVHARLALIDDERQRREDIQ